MFVFAPPPQPSLPVVGSEARFAVRRIFCVGRNYAAHAREMGMDPSKEPPFFFDKPADTLVEDGGAVPYPPATCITKSSWSSPSGAAAATSRAQRRSTISTAMPWAST